MRILIAIPHFYDPSGNGRYGSTKPDPQPRVAALTQSLRNLYTIYAGPQEYWYRGGERLQSRPANQSTQVSIDTIICTALDYHLLDQLVLPPDLYVHRRFDCDPLFLGYECHTVLEEQLENYDLFGYMEDDLILHDPTFFNKLHYLRQIAGEDVVVQPNRYERYGTMQQFKKVYIDFELERPPDAINPRAEMITISSLGESVEFYPVTNRHAGCFFLSKNQLAHWIDQPYFGDRATNYVGPLESAATLGVMRTFKVYKPAPHYANFLEIEHYGQMWSHQLAAVRFGGQPSPTQ